MPQGVVYCSSVSLHLNFRMQTALFSNLKSSLAPKIHDTLIWGNRHFALFPGRFCKGIWEAKLFAMPQGVVYCSSVSLHLNFRMQTALFSNLKSSLAPKIHDTLIWGNRHFALFPGRFSKDIWEAKLFGVAENIVWRRSGRLNLNFECQRLYFSNLKSPLAPKIHNAHIWESAFSTVSRSFF